MQFNHPIYTSIIILLLLLSFSSCTNKEKQETVDLSVFETLQTDGEWAVITEPYVAFRDKPDLSSTVKAHGRLGDVAHIIGKAIVPDTKRNTSTVWYQFDQGFISELSVTVYTNKLQAQSASDQLSRDTQ